MKPTIGKNAGVKSLVKATRRRRNATATASFKGVAEDYLPVHNWFDESKAFLPDLRHHAEGIFLCERLLGVTLRNSTGRAVPVRLVGEQHVRDDLGWIPTVKDVDDADAVPAGAGRDGWARGRRGPAADRP